MGFLIQLVLGQLYGRIGLGWALWACGKIQATLTLAYQTDCKGKLESPILQWENNLGVLYSWEKQFHP